MKTTTKWLIALALLLVPFAARYLWFNRGAYAPNEPSREVVIALPEAETGLSADTPASGAGSVVFDLAHANNLDINDLAAFQERLAARGVEVVFDEIGPDAALRTATAYVVLAPTRQFGADERAAVLEFVEAGGRVLIAADPTRSVPPDDPDFLSLQDIFFPESAIPSANSLAGVFGVAYFDDYLYDLESADGNYRNVRFEPAGGHPVTAGVGELVFFAAHSLQGGEPLLAGGEGVLSNVRTGETGFAPAVSAAEGGVVLLGDLSALTAPFHTAADNDRFLSNVADWLATSERGWGLADFPHNFDDDVDLVPLAGEGTIDPAILAYAGALQETFAAAGIGLGLAGEVTGTHDVLYVGTYADAGAVEELLSANGVTVDAPVDEIVTEEGAEGEETEATPPPAGGTLEIEGLGVVDIPGTSLYLETVTEDGADAVVVLAEDAAALREALDLLLAGLPESCLEAGGLVLCSAGEAPPPTEEPPVIDDGGGGQGGGGGIIEPTGFSIFIFSNDDGAEGVRTSAAEWEAALAGAYEVVVWSMLLDGIPTEDDLAGYDAYIVDSGDFAFEDEDADALVMFFFLGKPVLFIGAQPIAGPSDATAQLADVAVGDADHAAAAGLPAEVALALSDSEVPAFLLTDEDFDTSGETEVVFLLRRGSGSPEPGAPVLVLNSGLDGRFGIGFFEFYRLPEDVRTTLALNLAAWLTEG